MEGIQYDNSPELVIQSTNDPFVISYYKDDNYFKNLQNYVSFIKGCEKLIRISDAYKKFIRQLRDLNLVSCQVLGNVSDDDGSVTIEMHHGPILTLFDYCAIVLDYHLRQGETVNSFMIANEVIDEHYNNHVQTIMLSKTPHQAVDSGRLFINFKQARGDLNAFLKKYRLGLNDYHIKKINDYIDLSKKYNSNDNGLFDLKNTVASWKYEVQKNKQEDE